MRMTKPLANEKKVERKWRTNSKMDNRGHCQRVRSGHAQDYKMQILVHLNSQNVEGWMAKQLSAGCVNIVVACMLSTDYIWLHKSGNSEKNNLPADRNQPLRKQDCSSTNMPLQDPLVFQLNTQPFTNLQWVLHVLMSHYQHSCWQCSGSSLHLTSAHWGWWVWSCLPLEKSPDHTTATLHSHL